MRKLAKQFRWKAVGLVLFALMAGGAGLMTADAPTADAAVTFKGQMGGGEGGVSVNLFLPSQIMVHQGDTVEWSNPYEEPHTVSFGNLPPGDPAEPHDAALATSFDGSKPISSGFVTKGSKFSVTFTKLGAYTFVCLIHPGRKVDVFVLGPGATIPPQNDASSQATKDAVASAVAAGNAAAAAVKIPAPTKNADGTSSYTVPTGPVVSIQGSQAGAAVMKFMVPKLQIGVGDSVTWTADTIVPHTVTLVPPSGPPAGLNPFQTLVPPGPVDGTQFLNGSFGGVPLFNATSSFSLTFTKAGTYTYICLLHADQGMAGVIVVGPPGSGVAPAAAGAITPPSTGDGGLLDVGSGAWMIYAGLLLLAASMTAGAYVAIKR
jgi:plastocyanin